MRRCIFLFFLTIVSLSCSLNYANGENSEDKIPEFSFTHAEYIKYESSKKTVSLYAEKLEQYKNDGSVFAKNAVFETYNDDKIEMKGSSELLSADSRNELYTLFGRINLFIADQNMEIATQSLMLNRKSEQLTSGINDEVMLTKDDTVVTGRGFSASGISRTYSFLGYVDGVIKTNDEADNASEAQDEKITEAEMQGDGTS